MTLSTEDRLDILEVLARADDAASRRDADAYASLLTEGAVLEGEKGEFHGREDIRRAVVEVWNSEGDATVHLTLNAVIEGSIGTNDEVVAHSTLMIVTAESTPKMLTISRITHDLRKEQGSWRIARRKVGNA